MTPCTLLASIAFIAVFGLIVVAFDQPRARRQREADAFIAFERTQQKRGFE